MVATPLLTLLVGGTQLTHTMLDMPILAMLGQEDMLGQDMPSQDIMLGQEDFLGILAIVATMATTQHTILDKTFRTKIKRIIYARNAELNKNTSCGLNSNSLKVRIVFLLLYMSLSF